MSKFNKIYEFKYQVNGRNCDMSMTSVSGHLLGLEFEQKYRKWYSCQPSQLFHLPVQKQCPQNMEPIKVILKFYIALKLWLKCAFGTLFINIVI